MSSQTDKPNEVDLDTMMVDWLYGELDPKAAARFEEYLEENPEAKREALSLKKTRAVFQKPVEADPPAGISSKLLHEAALHASKSKGAPGGFWRTLAGWFQPVLLHPAATAAATFVLVAGVAGTLYLRQGNLVHEAMEPAMESDLRESESAPGQSVPAKSAMADSVAEAPLPTEEAGDRLEPEAMNVGEAGLVDPATAERVEEERQKALKPRPLATRKGQAGRSRVMVATDKKRKARKGGKAVPSVNGITGADSPRPKGAVRQKEAARATDEGGVDAEEASLAYDGFADDDVTQGAREQAVSAPAPANRDKAGRVPWTAKQEQDLTRAAQEDRCRDAGRIANDILERAPGFYENRIKGSKALARCRREVAAESKLRRAARKRATEKKTAPTTKKAP